MNALHVLVFNPSVTPHLLEMMKDLDPTMAQDEENIHFMTPVGLFLRLKGMTNLEHGAGISIDHALRIGLSWNDIRKIMILDNSVIVRDEYAFVQAAASTECDLNEEKYD